MTKKKGVKISKSEYTLRSNRFQPIVTPDGAILRARKEARRRFRMARPPPFDLALVQPRAVRSAAHGGPRHPSAKFTHEHFPPSFLIPGRTPRGAHTDSFSFLVFRGPRVPFSTRGKPPLPQESSYISSGRSAFL